jgi:antitoxin VapB
MALSIKTDEADRLARDLARFHGETLTETVTVALRERWARDCAKPRTREEKIAAMDAVVERMRPYLDTRPVTKEEWDEASGDTD